MVVMNLIDIRMEVSRRRIPRKHLEPARPLRRLQVDMDIQPPIYAPCAQAFLDADETNIGIEQFCKIVNLQKQKEERISYSRDFLIALARCPAAIKRPEFLPDHPVVLPSTRSPNYLPLHESG
uniref:uncharacterized protein C8orf88 homolog isoform X2 n=1 Tax=Doryrhamphus excisus TaxID=161450 RepID=UPI0025AEBF5B|nr:uncharacterized protein C8orf88 homolog isoform X2 [Doryrhamphus excisus]